MSLITIWGTNYIPGHALHEKGCREQKSVGPLVGYGRCGGSRYLWRERFRMKATEGASPIRSSPPAFSPHPTTPLSAPRVSGFGLNYSWKD